MAPNVGAKVNHRVEGPAQAACDGLAWTYKAS